MYAFAADELIAMFVGTAVADLLLYRLGDIVRDADDVGDGFGAFGGLGAGGAVAVGGI